MPAVLKRLFYGPRRTFRAPPNSCIYAIGDIHGRADLLDALYRRIQADQTKAERRVVVHVGDYVDRGDRSRAVIDLIMSKPLAGFECASLRGNHEQLMLDFLDNAAVGTMWFANGGDATLASYRVGLKGGGDRDTIMLRLQQEFRDKLPPEHREFLSALKLMHREGDYLFVHAGIRPGVPLDAQAAEDVLWIREEFLHSNADHGACVVHGHTISDQPQFKPNRIGIDTGAFMTGRLTCLVLENDTQRVLQT
jgi:serine/threonine protein phosphatase 1